MNDKPIIVIAASSGGHLTEAQFIFEDVIKKYENNIFILSDYSPRTNALKNKKLLFPAFGYNPFDYLKNFLKLIHLYLKIKPDIILSTGAEIGMIAIWTGWLLGIKTIFIETITRINNPTMSARAVYRVVDCLLVQNPELAEKLGPKAQYHGGLI